MTNLVEFYFNFSSIKGEEFYSFSGIPYAEPPIGNLRFKKPVAKNPWTGIFDAKNSKNHVNCLQAVGVSTIVHIAKIKSLNEF